MINGLLSVMLPVFGCIIIGYLLVQRGAIDAKGADAINRFVYFASFPALLFSFVSRTPIERVWNPAFLSTWLISLSLTYLVTLVVSRTIIGDGAAETAVRAMNCTCANTAFMGIPLLVLALGKDAALPGILATVVIVSVIFNLTIALIEFGRHRESLAAGELLRRIACSLARNPLMLAVLAGAFCSALLQMPKALMTFAELLGNAAVPGSLIAVGAFIASQRIPETISASLVPTAIKLLVHPLMTWGVVTWVVAMDPMWSAAAVLLAALPSAASCFVIAKQHGILVAETSGTIWLSTVLSGGTFLMVLSLLNLV